MPQKDRPTKSRFGLALRTIALTLVASFLVSDISHAAPGLDFSLFSGDLAANPSLLKFPLQTAKISEIYSAKGGKTPKLLIHIQDAHTNFSAQENISKVLEDLASRYKVKTIFVEGGTGDDSLSFIRPLAPKKTRERVAKKYLLAGEIKGVEYLDLVSDHLLTVWGVEDKALYDKNLKTYASIAAGREAALGYLSEIDQRVCMLKEKLFPKELKSFDECVEAFEKKEKDFSEYHSALSTAAAKAGVNLFGYPNFLSLEKLKAAEENIDFKKANEEQNELLSSVFQNAAEREETLALLSGEVSKLKSTSVSSVFIYEALLQRARSAGLNPASYENLAKYTDYLKTFADVDPQKLFEETKNLKTQIYREALGKDEAAMYLHEISDYLSHLKALYSLQISKEDFEAYMAYRKDVRFETIVLLAFLNKHLYDLGRAGDVQRFLKLIDDNRKAVEDFYHTNESRDQSFVDKALKAMDKDKISTAVLIAGGYHTSNLKELLKSRGVSYAIVTPQISQETNIKRYEEILLGQLGDENPLAKKTVTANGAKTLAEPMVMDRPVDLIVRNIAEEVTGVNLVDMKTGSPRDFEVRISKYAPTAVPKQAHQTAPASAARLASVKQRVLITAAVILTSLGAFFAWPTSKKTDSSPKPAESLISENIPQRKSNKIVEPKVSSPQPEPQLPEVAGVKPDLDHAVNIQRKSGTGNQIEIRTEPDGSIYSKNILAYQYDPKTRTVTVYGPSVVVKNGVVYDDFGTLKVNSVYSYKELKEYAGKLGIMVNVLENVINDLARTSELTDQERKDIETIIAALRAEIEQTKAAQKSQTPSLRLPSRIRLDLPKSDGARLATQQVLIKPEQIGLTEKREKDYAAALEAYDPWMTSYSESLAADERTKQAILYSRALAKARDELLMDLMTGWEKISGNKKRLKREMLDYVDAGFREIILRRVKISPALTAQELDRILDDANTVYQRAANAALEESLLSQVKDPSAAARLAIKVTETVPVSAGLDIPSRLNLDKEGKRYAFVGNRAEISSAFSAGGAIKLEYFINARPQLKVKVVLKPDGTVESASLTYDGKPISEFPASAWLRYYDLLDAWLPSLTGKKWTQEGLAAARLAVRAGFIHNETGTPILLTLTKSNELSVNRVRSLPTGEGQVIPIQRVYLTASLKLSPDQKAEGVLQDIAQRLQTAPIDTWRNILENAGYITANARLATTPASSTPAPLNKQDLIRKVVKAVRNEGLGNDEPWFFSLQYLGEGQKAIHGQSLHGAVGLGQGLHDLLPDGINFNPNPLIYTDFEHETTEIVIEPSAARLASQAFTETTTPKLTIDIRYGGHHNIQVLVDSKTGNQIVLSRSFKADEILSNERLGLIATDLARTLDATFSGRLVLDNDILPILARSGLTPVSLAPKKLSEDSILGVFLELSGWFMDALRMLGQIVGTALSWIIRLQPDQRSTRMNPKSTGRPIDDDNSPGDAARLAGFDAESTIAQIDASISKRNYFRVGLLAAVAVSFGLGAAFFTVFLKSRPTAQSITNEGNDQGARLAEPARFETHRTVPRGVIVSAVAVYQGVLATVYQQTGGAFTRYYSRTFDIRDADQKTLEAVARGVRDALDKRWAKRRLTNENVKGVVDNFELPPQTLRVGRPFLDQPDEVGARLAMNDRLNKDVGVMKQGKYRLKEPAITALRQAGINTLRDITNLPAVYPEGIKIPGIGPQSMGTIKYHLHSRGLLATHELDSVRKLVAALDAKHLDLRNFFLDELGDSSQLAKVSEGIRIAELVNWLAANAGQDDTFLKKRHGFTDLGIEGLEVFGVRSRVSEPASARLARSTPVARLGSRREGDGDLLKRTQPVRRGHILAILADARHRLNSSAKGNTNRYGSIAALIDAAQVLATRTDPIMVFGPILNILQALHVVPVPAGVATASSSASISQDKDSLIRQVVQSLHDQRVGDDDLLTFNFKYLGPPKKTNQLKSVAGALGIEAALDKFLPDDVNFTKARVDVDFDKYEVKIVVEPSTSAARLTWTSAREKKAAKVVAEKLTSVLEAPTTEMAERFRRGGYEQEGWGVSTGAAINGSFALSGDQGYFTEDKNAKGQTGKEVFLETVGAMQKFFDDRNNKLAANGHSVKLIIKPGIGGQHTPFQGTADIFQIIDPSSGLIVGEYELGKDFASSIQAQLTKLGAEWDEVVVIPSSKSGSTDETMMIFVKIMRVLLEKIATDKGLNGTKFSSDVFDILHEINFPGGKERQPEDLFKVDPAQYGTDSLVTLVAERTSISRTLVQAVFAQVFGNMFFETTDDVKQSRLSAFVRNSKLADDLGDDAPRLGAMFENVGGRWTGDLHMMTFLAYHHLDAEAYWNVRNRGIHQARAGTHRGNNIGNHILDNNFKHIALVIPDELFWFGKSIEQNFNESIWQEGFANLVAIRESDWEAQSEHYQGQDDSLVLSLTGRPISGFAPHVVHLPIAEGYKKDKKIAVEFFADLWTTFYSATATGGYRLIARALNEANYKPEQVDINDLDNKATQVVRENLFVLQPYVELGKNLLEGDLKQLQARESSEAGAITADFEIRRAEAVAGKIQTNVPSIEIPSNAADPKNLTQAIIKAAKYAKAQRRKFVPFIYLEGKKFNELRNSLIKLGYEWVLQGTGDQHISYQQVLSQPEKYFVFFVSFVPEQPIEGDPAIGFAKGYLHNVSAHHVRDAFAEASYKALTIRRAEQGGQGVFLRLEDSPEKISMLHDAAKKAAARLASNSRREINFLKTFMIKKVAPIFEELFEGGPAEARKRMKKEAKIDETPVTIYDPLIERQFHQHKVGQFPDDGIIGEELATTRFDRRMWTIDPIDGTADFEEAGDHFGTLTALYADGAPQVAAGYWPRLKLDGKKSKSLVTAQADTPGIRLNGRLIKKAQIEKINQSKVIYIGSHPQAKKALRQDLRKYFEQRGYTVVDSRAGGGEVAEMMLKGTAHLYIHLTPASVDAPTNAFFAEKLGLKTSDRYGDSIFPIRFHQLREKLFFDSLIIGSPESHAEAMAAFQALGDPAEDLPWTDAERNMPSVELIRHLNQQIRHAKQRTEADSYAGRKKTATQRTLRHELAAAVAPTAGLINEHTQQELERLVQEEPFQLAVLDPQTGALSRIKKIYDEKSKTGKSTLIGQSGPPGAGKSEGGKYIAEAVAKQTGSEVLVLKEDNTLIQRDPVNLRGNGLQGKFQWEIRDRMLDSLRNGKSILKPSFDDATGGNLMISLDSKGAVVIHHGNRTIRIGYKKGNRTFTHEEILLLPGKEPKNLAEERANPTSDTGVFISGSTKFRIRLEDGRLVIGFQSMEIISVNESGDTVPVERLTEHEIDLLPGNRAKVHTRIPAGQDHLNPEANFELELVKDPSKADELRKAKPLKEFVRAGTPVVFDGQFAYLRLQDGKFVRHSGLFDVALNYRAPRIVRWTRDWGRSAERGRTPSQQLDNAARFWERAGTEEELSVPSGVAQGIIQVNTTDLAESIQRLVHYGREQWPAYKSLLRQLGIQPEKIDEWQRENLIVPKLLELLVDLKGSITRVRTVDGLEEYQVGDFLFHVEEGRSSLSDAAVERNRQLFKRMNSVMGGNTVVDLSGLGFVTTVNAGRKRFGKVSVWNKGELVTDRLNVLAKKGDQASTQEGEHWIDGFIAQEIEMHRRGVVDAKPSLAHRRILPVHGQMIVTVVSPEANLIMGPEALELYGKEYIAGSEIEIIYLSSDVQAQIPEAFKPYYRKRVLQTWGNNIANDKLQRQEILEGFYQNHFETVLPGRERTPLSRLPDYLKAVAREKVDIVPVMIQFRNWDVEHPALFKERLSHMRSVYTAYFIEQTSRSYFDHIRTDNGTPQLLWTTLLVDAYPDKFNKFYQLLKIFYEELLDNPNVIDEMTNSEVRDSVQEKYQQSYDRKGFESPAIDPFSWRSFDHFLRKTRSLSSSLAGARLASFKVKDRAEWRRLQDVLARPISAVMTDLDGTVTKTNQATGKVARGFVRYHRANVRRLAQLADRGVLVAPTTNRRPQKAKAYAEEILAKTSQPKDARLEVYWASGLGGMDFASKEEFTNFNLSFSDLDQNKVIDALLASGTIVSTEDAVVEKMDGKVNVYIHAPPGSAERNKLIQKIQLALRSLRPSGLDLKVMDGGEHVLSILPRVTDKARPKKFIKARYGLNESQILKLLDQPQKGRADAALARYNGIHVGDDVRNLPPGVISTKKAIGLTGPQAAYWVLRHANFVPLSKRAKPDSAARLSADQAGLAPVENQVKKLLVEVEKAGTFNRLYAVVKRLEGIEKLSFGAAVRHIEKYKMGNASDKLEYAKKFLKLFHATWSEEDGLPEGVLREVEPAGDKKTLRSLLRLFSLRRIWDGIHRVHGFLWDSGEGEAPVVDLRNRLGTVKQFIAETGEDFDLIASLEYQRNDGKPTITGSYKRRQFFNYFMENLELFRGKDRIKRVYINSSGNAIQGLLFTVNLLKDLGLLPKDLIVVMVAHPGLDDEKKKKIEKQYGDTFGGILEIPDFIKEAKKLGMFRGKSEKKLNKDLLEINLTLSSLDDFTKIHNQKDPKDKIAHIRPSNDESMVLGGASMLHNLWEGAKKLGFKRLDQVGIPLGGGGPAGGMALLAYYIARLFGQFIKIFANTSTTTVAGIGGGMAIQAPQSFVRRIQKALGRDFLEFGRIPEPLVYKAFIDLRTAGYKVEPTSAVTLARLYWIMSDPSQWHLLKPGPDGQKKVIGLVLSGGNVGENVINYAADIYRRDKMTGLDFLWNPPVTDNFIAQDIIQQAEKYSKIVEKDSKVREPRGEQVLQTKLNSVINAKSPAVTQKSRREAQRQLRSITKLAAARLAPQLGPTRPELEKEFIRQVEASSPEHVKKPLLFDIRNDKGRIQVTLLPRHLEEYDAVTNPDGLGLLKWLKDYEKEAKVATAGIRSSQNVLYPWDTRFRVNQVGVALATLGKALAAKELYHGAKLQKMAAGEVRYNTPEYVELVARIQAAQGIRTYLPNLRKTLTIWMTSFLTFMLDLAGAEFGTSSHANSSFFATKDIDPEGSQYLPEESLRFVGKIREIFNTVQSTGKYEFEIAAADDPLIDGSLMERLEDGTKLYAQYLRNGVATDVNLERIRGVKNKILVDNVGGALHRTTEPILEDLGIDGSFEWMRTEQDSFFHGIGKEEKEGKIIDHSQDATIIKRDKKTGEVVSIPVMERMGYDKLLQNKPVGTTILMGDPDGDRLVTAQIESRARAGFLEKVGVDYLTLDDQRILALYSPNQSFFMTMAYQAESLRAAGLWDDHPRFIIMTTASSAAWREWAQKNGVNVLNVPVGFKEIAAMQRKIEAQLQKAPNEPVIVTDVFGRTVDLGVQPRMLFAGEESGGAVIGPEKLIKSFNGREAIAMREKSDGEMLVIQAAMTAHLENQSKMLSDYLFELFENNDIQGRFDVREDVVYYNQSEPDPDVLDRDKLEGEKKRTKNYVFFLSMALAFKDRATTLEQVRVTLNELFAKEGLPFLDLSNISFVGDGVFFEFPDKVLEIRPSGTDAKSKAYAMGKDKLLLARYASALGNYSGDITNLHQLYVPEKYSNEEQVMQMQWEVYQQYYKNGLPDKTYVPPAEMAEQYALTAARLALAGEDIVAADKVKVSELSIPGVQSVANIKDVSEKRNEIIKLNPVVLLVRSATVVDDDLVKQLPRLKHIIRLGHGLNNITASKRLLEEKGITIRGTKGSAKSITAWTLRAIGSVMQGSSTSEFDQVPQKVFLSPETFIAASNKKIEALPEPDQFEQRLRATQLFKNLNFKTLEELKGQTIAVIGASGDIGEEIAVAARNLGMNVLLNSRSLEQSGPTGPNADYEGKTTYRVATKEEIYKTANYIVLITGLGPENVNAGMIDAEAIDLMIQNKGLKALINPDRRELVREEELLRLLDAPKSNAEYIVDEVPKLAALKEHSKVTYTHHIGGSTEEAEAGVLEKTNSILTEIAAARLTGVEDLFRIGEADLGDGVMRFLGEIQQRGTADSNLADYRTDVPVPTGKEKGTFLYADWGGTNLRIGGIKLKGDQTIDLLPEWNQKRDRTLKWSDELKKSGRTMVRFTAEKIAAYARENLDQGQKYFLGLSFGFSSNRDKGVGSARVVKNTSVKGFDFNDLLRGQDVGDDIIELLQNDLSQLGASNIVINAGPNDTESTRLIGEFLHPDTIAGGIFGTGHNASIRSKGGESVNLEMARSSHFKRNDFDKELDRLSSNPGEQLLEKAISGKYLGPLLGLTLTHLIENEGLFQGRSSDVIRDRDFEHDETYGGIRTEHLSEIAAWDLKSPNGVAAATNWVHHTWGIEGATAVDLAVVSGHADAIVTRSAQLAAQGFAAILLDKQGMDTPEIPVGYAVDGTVINSYPGYEKIMLNTLRKIFDAEYVDSYINIHKISDGSGIGAALTAAVIASQSAARLSAPAAPVEEITLEAEIHVGSVHAGKFLNIIVNGRRVKVPAGGLASLASNIDQALTVMQLARLIAGNEILGGGYTKGEVIYKLSSFHIRTTEASNPVSFYSMGIGGGGIDDRRKLDVTRLINDGDEVIFDIDPSFAWSHGIPASPFNRETFLKGVELKQIQAGDTLAAIGRFSNPEPIRDVTFSGLSPDNKRLFYQDSAGAQTIAVKNVTSVLVAKFQDAGSHAAARLSMASLSHDDTSLFLERETIGRDFFEGFLTALDEDETKDIHRLEDLRLSDDYEDFNVFPYEDPHGGNNAFVAIAFKPVPSNLVSEDQPLSHRIVIKASLLTQKMGHPALKFLAEKPGAFVEQLRPILTEHWRQAYRQETNRPRKVQDPDLQFDDSDQKSFSVANPTQTFIVRISRFGYVEVFRKYIDRKFVYRRSLHDWLEANGPDGSRTNLKIITIGRHPSSDIVINGETVSNRHAALILHQTPGGIEVSLRDGTVGTKESTNHTYYPDLTEKGAKQISTGPTHLFYAKKIVPAPADDSVESAEFGQMANVSPARLAARFETNTNPRVVVSAVSVSEGVLVSVYEKGIHPVGYHARVFTEVRDANQETLEKIARGVRDALDQLLVSTPSTTVNVKDVVDNFNLANLENAPPPGSERSGARLAAPSAQAAVESPAVVSRKIGGAISSSISTIPFTAPVLISDTPFGPVLSGFTSTFVRQNDEVSISISRFEANLTTDQIIQNIGSTEVQRFSVSEFQALVHKDRIEQAQRLASSSDVKITVPLSLADSDPYNVDSILRTIPQDDVRRLLQQFDNGRARRLWTGLLGDLGQIIFNTSTRSVLPLTIPAQAFLSSVKLDARDSLALLSQLNQVAKAKDAHLVLVLTHEGELTSVQINQLEALSTGWVEVMVQQVESNRTIIESTLAGLQRKGFELKHISHFVVGAELNQIERVGYKEFQQSAAYSQTLKDSLKVLGVQYENGAIFSAADILFAELMVIFPQSAFTTSYLGNLRQVQTNFGWIYIIGPIVDTKIHEALLSNKQVLRAA